MRMARTLVFRALSLRCDRVLAMNGVTDDCEACALTDGRRALPGGRIHERGDWLVEHCVGPLGTGTLIVKPRRHVTAIGELTDDEAAALGPLLRDASAIASQLVEAEQVYNCLWSHAGGRPVHIHYVVQPITRAQMERHSSHGPVLQTAMFAVGELPDRAEVERIAGRARELFGHAVPE